MTESYIEGKVCEFATAWGFIVRKFVSPGHRSVPDRLFMHACCGVFFIEFKNTGKEPTSAQIREHNRYRKKGVHVFVIDDIEEGKQLLIRIHNERSLPEHGLTEC